VSLGEQHFYQNFTEDMFKETQKYLLVKKKFEYQMFKSYDFSNRGTLDVKPISLIFRILWRSAGPYSGPPQHFVELSL
jgi:hypothetical protein